MDYIVTEEEEDGLFVDRLQAFCTALSGQIEAFAARENKPVKTIRKRVAEWHLNYLFRCEGSQETKRLEAREQARNVLENMSQQLVSLNQVTGHHSFLLVVDPNNEADDGFLGGTIIGREFWRTMRGGGDSGAKMFKARCNRERNAQSQHTSTIDLDDTPIGQNSGTKTVRSSTLKNEVYIAMRDLLKSTSGIRNAEMKWSKPEKLKAYGVAIVGWPSHMEYKNPSQMTVKELGTIMTMVQRHELYFERLGEPSNHLIP